MQQYSPFFKTLHDDTSPTGNLGRGSHYSILRFVSWHSELLTNLKVAEYHDLAIIWDEDHDIRIVEAIHALYYSGLLSTALFVGERKGSFTLLISEETASKKGATWLKQYKSDVQNITESLENGDSWPAQIGYISQPEAIINDSNEKVIQYLATINMLWQLGNKKIQ